MGIRSLIEDLPGANFQGKYLVDEMDELGKLRTAIMIEKCLSKNQVIACPKPRKAYIRSNGQHNELKVMGDLSDILGSKNSPPYYSGSPPIRSSNPIIQDACFCGEKASRDNTFWLPF